MERKGKKKENVHHNDTGQAEGSAERMLLSAGWN